jgi:K+-transporting ATPase KdpF subunit
MNATEIVALVLGVALSGYLLFALLRPEKFQ